MVSDFTVHNLPYGIFTRKAAGQVDKRIGVAIGTKIIDCKALADHAILPKVFSEPSLNRFMGCGKDSWCEVRAVLQNLVTDDCANNLESLAAKKGFDLSECLVD